MANEGLVRDPRSLKYNNPGGDCYWAGGQPKYYIIRKFLRTLELVKLLLLVVRFFVFPFGTH